MASSDATHVRSAGSTTVAPAALGGGVKRAVDFVLALGLLVFVAPLMGLVAMLVTLQDGGPAVFRHQRLGYGGQSFGCLKFRSMAVDGQERLAELLASSEEARVEWEANHKLRNDPRITPLGQFLRRSSLDELPQLFNILAGQMSFVGPRPIVTAEVIKYGAAFHLYALARPGLTGLWQISGRSDVSYEERVRLDAKYVGGWSLVEDLRILFGTVPAVLRSRGSC